MRIKKIAGVATLTVALSASVGSAVEIIKMGSEAVALGVNGITSVTTTTEFDPGAASKLIVTISAEARRNAGPSDPIVESVFFGSQALEFAVGVTNGPGEQQRTEIWYLDAPIAGPNTITANWTDEGAGNGNVNGTGFSFLSLNEVELGAPTITEMNSDGMSITTTVPADTDGDIDDSLLVSSFVANGGSIGLDTGASSPGITELSALGNIGSAASASAFELIDNTGLPAGITHAFTASGNRPTVVSAVWETGDLIAPVLPPVPGDVTGDRIVDINDFNAIRDSLGQRGLPIGVGADLAGNDGVVNLADLQEFLANFPTDATVGGINAAGVAVPEPSSALLVVLASAAPLLSRRRSARPATRRGSNLID